MSDLRERILAFRRPIHADNWMMPNVARDKRRNALVDQIVPLLDLLEKEPAVIPAPTDLRWLPDGTRVRHAFDRPHVLGTITGYESGRRVYSVRWDDGSDADNIFSLEVLPVPPEPASSGPQPPMDEPALALKAGDPVQLRDTPGTWHHGTLAESGNPGLVYITVKRDKDVRSMGLFPIEALERQEPPATATVDLAYVAGILSEMEAQAKFSWLYRRALQDVRVRLRIMEKGKS